MEFVGKKILLICKETYSYPLYFLAQKWSVKNEVAAFFFNPCETMYNKCLLNDTTYYAFKNLENIRLYTSDNIARRFTGILNDEVIDPEYLENLEHEYTHYQNLNCQIISTQYFTRHYHFRNYMAPCTYVQQQNWLILNYKNVISILDDFKPTVIIDCDNAELARCVLQEVAYSRHIPYITIEYPRYENYKTYSYQLNKHVEEQFSEVYDGYLNGSESNLEEELEYIRSFREKARIMPKEYEGTVTAQYKPDSLGKVFKILVSRAEYFIEQDYVAHNLKLKKTNKILYNDSLEYIRYYVHYELLKRKLLQHNKYFLLPQKGEKYVYMPLHLIPESTTFSISPFYVNELSIIEAVSKSLPIGWWLYVKEHQAMVGEREVEFYRKVNRLPNVKMVQLNYYQDPKPWITNAMGVVTISGTTAYEAAMLNKPSVIFSDVSFKLIEGIQRVDSFEKLPEAFRNFVCISDNRKSCAAYIATVKEMGQPINLKYLMAKGENIIRGKDFIDEKYEEMLQRLESLYLKAYSDYT